MQNENQSFCFLKKPTNKQLSKSKGFLSIKTTRSAMYKGSLIILKVNCYHGLRLSKQWSWSFPYKPTCPECHLAAMVMEPPCLGAVYPHAITSNGQELSSRGGAVDRPDMRFWQGPRRLPAQKRSTHEHHGRGASLRRGSLSAHLLGVLSSRSSRSPSASLSVSLGQSPRPPRFLLAEPPRSEPAVPTAVAPPPAASPPRRGDSGGGGGGGGESRSLRILLLSEPMAAPPPALLPRPPHRG